MVSRRPVLMFGAVLLWTALLLAGCGGDEGGEASPVPTPTDTPPPTRTLTAFEAVPTWTPDQPATPLSRATIDYDYGRPTTTFQPTDPPTPSLTPWIAATRTSPPRTPVPRTPITTLATSAPLDPPVPAGEEVQPNPSLVITADMLNTLLQGDPTHPVRQIYTSVPVISFEDGAVVISGNLRMTIDGVPGAQPVEIRAAITTLNGEPALLLIEAILTTDGSPFGGDPHVALTPLRTMIDEQIDAIYAELRPTDLGYFISQISVEDGMLRVDTRSIV